MINGIKASFTDFVKLLRLTIIKIILATIAEINVQIPVKKISDSFHLKSPKFSINN